VPARGGRMRRIAVPSAMLMIALAADGAWAAPQAGAQEARNKAVARQFLEKAFGPGWNVELVERLHTPDFILHTRRGDMGLKEDRDAVLGWKSAAPDLVMTVDDIVAEGDKVAIRWTATGTNTGEGNGFPATGKRITATGMTFWRMKDGRIAEEWGVVDMVSVLRQLGVLPERRPSPPPAPRSP